MKKSDKCKDIKSWVRTAKRHIKKGEKVYQEDLEPVTYVVNVTQVPVPERVIPVTVSYAK